MNKNELESIALNCIERLDKEAQESRQMQDEKIGKIEKKVEGFEQQLTRLAESLRSLRSLAEGLNSILKNGDKR